MKSVADELRELEESLWVASTRFDVDRMNTILAPGFVEFGRSGRRYDRAAVLAMEPDEFEARLPLPALSVRMPAPDVALVTYRSEVQHGDVVSHANRSSPWRRTPVGWRLEFHQGTPIP